MAKMHVSKILQYPVKGMRAAELETAVLTKNGFPHDRRFMVLQVADDGSYHNMAIAHFPEMSRYFPTIDEQHGTLTILYKPPGGPERSIDIPLRPETSQLRTTQVTMHLSAVTAYILPEEINTFLSSCFGYPVILVYLGENLRDVRMSVASSPASQQTTNGAGGGGGGGGGAGWLNSLSTTASNLLFSTNNNHPNTTTEKPSITFADCAPYLIVSSKSMDDVHPRLPDGEEMDIMKFRPNIIVSGATEPWDEDFWAELTITSPAGDAHAPIKIACEHNCGRCKSINIDYETGKPATGEAGTMLKKLMKDRRVDPGCKWSPVFGRYSFLLPESEGRAVRVGDEVEVTKRNGERTRFDWEGLCTK